MTVKGKTAPVHAMKAYGWSRGAVPHILNLCNIQRCMVNFTLQITKLMRPSFFWYIMQHVSGHLPMRMGTTRYSEMLVINYQRPRRAKDSTTLWRKPEISCMKLPSFYILLFLPLLGHNVSLSSLSWGQNS